MRPAFFLFRSSVLIRLSLFAGCALAAGGPSAFAREDAEDDVVVVTGTATPATQEKIGHALTILPSERIEDQGYSFLSDALRHVPGLAVSRGGGFGAITQLRMRGAEGNHTLVLLDGVDISNAGEGETDLSTLLSGDIERIEVLRGPQSGLYGSNALAGVVNIVTRRNVDGHYVNAALEAGSFETKQLQAGAGFGDGESYASAGFHMLTNEGYDVSALDIPIGPAAIAKDSEGVRVATAYLRGGRKLAPFLRVDGIGRFVRKTAELDGQAFAPPIAGRTFDDPSEQSNRDVNLGGAATLSLLNGRWETIASAAYTETEFQTVTYFYPSGARSPGGNASSRAKLLAQSTLAFGAPGFLSYLTGFAETKKETYRNLCLDACSPQQALEQSRDLFGFGAQYRAEIADQLYVSATARRDENDRFGDADTFGLSAAWTVPNLGARPHASFGTGVTNPTFVEQFGFDPATYVGNPDLVPEKAEGWDVGLEQTFMGGRFVLDLTWFESTLKNEIVTVFGGAPSFISTPINSTARSRRQGLEASFRARPSEAIDIVGSYTWLDATEPSGVEPRRPEHLASLEASWRLGALQLNAGIAHNGEQYDTDFSTFLPARLEAYTLVRLGASYRLSDALELYGRIENVTDEDYEEVISFRGAPQGVYVGLRFREGG